MAGVEFGDVQMSRFAAGASFGFGDVGVSLFAAVAIFGDVAALLFVIFGAIWVDSQSAECCKMHLQSTKE